MSRWMRRRKSTRGPSPTPPRRAVARIAWQLADVQLRPREQPLGGEALAGHRATVGEAHPRYGATLASLGAADVALGRVGPGIAALERGIASRRFGAADRVSLAYSRWWLTREPVDAQRVVDQYASIELGKPAVLEGVGSDVEREICKGIEERECSLTILRSPKHAGDEERLRAALGLRR